MIRYIKWLKIIIGIIIVLHSVIFIALIFQEQIIFRSEAVKDSYKLKILIPHKEYTWTSPDSSSDKRIIHNLIYPSRKKSKGYIFFLHGPIKNAEYHTQYISYFTDIGYTVWMMDYVGFGKSKGERSENKLYQDASIMFDSLAQKMNIAPKNIIIVGKELGTGIASKIAIEKQVEKLALISPFYNISSLYQDYIPWFPFYLFLNYKFPNGEHLAQFQGEVGIFLGANDMFIPYHNSRKLQRVLKPGDEFHEYDSKSSDNVMYEDNFQEDLKLFLKK